MSLVSTEASADVSKAEKNMTMSKKDVVDAIKVCEDYRHHFVCFGAPAEVV